jgi:hypothetical protein
MLNFPFGSLYIINDSANAAGIVVELVVRTISKVRNRILIARKANINHPVWNTIDISLLQECKGNIAIREYAFEHLPEQYKLR